MPIDSLGACIKKHRIQAHLTQAQLAKRVGVHSDTIYLLESNKVRVAVKYVIGIESILGCNLTSYDDYYKFAIHSDKRIKTIKSKFGLSTVDLATRIGATSTTLAKWEQGNGYVSVTAYQSLKKQGLI